MQVEALLARYEPRTVRTLFVAESPSSGPRFFYLGNSQLFRYTVRAFHDVWGDKVGDGQAFLEWFQSRGFYLVNLSEESVGYLHPAARREAHIRAIPSLSERLARYRPRSIVIAMKSLEKPVSRAIQYAQIEPDEVIVLPFPTRTIQNQRTFQEGLALFLRTQSRTTSQGVQR